MTVWKDVIGNIDGVEQISKILRKSSAPDVIDSIFQDMVKFMYFKLTGRNLATYLMEFDMLRRKAEARTIMGSGFPDSFVSALCAQGVALTKNVKTLVLTTLGNSSASQSDSAQMRRSSGPIWRCVAARCPRSGGSGYGVRGGGERGLDGLS